MFGTALIVFREVFEAALVVSIVAAATRGLPGRMRTIGGGVAAGVLGAVLVAAFAGVIANLASGVGQELFNASVLLAAVALISWHVLWMSRHGRELARHLGAVSAAVRAGTRPPSALLLVVAIAILREGSEVVLFIYGLAAGGSSAGSLAAGGLLGLAAGIAAGVALYSGLVRIQPHRMFSATNGLLLLVAAGMASTAAHFLVQADLLPALGSPLWDTSRLIANGSMPGQVLHALVGYDARPTGMQMIFFAAVLVAVGGAMQLLRRNGARPARPQAGMSPQPS
ncbi:MAG: FTR1 family protein [Nevskia sp.]|nr:FTR1 family protein [Nevskia sp.]